MEKTYTEKKIMAPGEDLVIITLGGLVDSMGDLDPDKPICGEKFEGAPVGNYDSAQALYGKLFNPIQVGGHIYATGSREYIVPEERTFGIENVVSRADPDHWHPLR